MNMNSSPFSYNFGKSGNRSISRFFRSHYRQLILQHYHHLKVMKQTTNSGAMRSCVLYGSHIVTCHAPYQSPYYHQRTCIVIDQINPNLYLKNRIKH
jgi:hypothetical protein